MGWPKGKPRAKRPKEGFEGFAFSRTIGTKHWCCPRCNQVNRTTIRPQNWVVMCTNEACHARYAIGEVFYHMHTGVRVPPPDTIMPDETRLKRGALLNQVYCSACSKVMYEDVFGRALEEGADPEHAYGNSKLRGFEHTEYRQDRKEKRELNIGRALMREFKRRCNENPRTFDPACQTLNSDGKRCEHYPLQHDIDLKCTLCSCEQWVPLMDGKPKTD